MHEIHIARDSDGKPVIAGDLGEKLSVSLSHDARYVLGVAGEGPQGCDLELITHRSHEDWRGLLGSAQQTVLDELAASEPLDVAGTRIWSAMECVYKAFATREVTLSVGAKDGRSILLGAKLSEGTVASVLTLPMVFTLGTERMVAMIVERDTTPAVAAVSSVATRAGTIDGAVPAVVASVVSASAAPGVAELAVAGFDVGSFSISGDPERRHFIVRRPLSFRDSATLDKSIPFTALFSSMGEVRELAMQPIADRIGADLSTGRYGMVTNHSAVRVLGKTRPSDVLEVHYWASAAKESPESMIDLYFDWRRVGRDGVVERIALGEMRTTWVELVSHGVVRPVPCPDYLADYVAARTPPTAEMMQPEALPEPLSHVRMGSVLWEKPAGPTHGPVLGESTLDTGLADANLVGNIYFAHYYGWQSRLIDGYVHGRMPDYYRGVGGSGTFACRSARVNHLRDAMPFDQIQVKMTLDALHENGAVLAFDYYHLLGPNHRQKLAHGRHELVWLAPDGHAARMPKAALDDLIARTRA